MNPYGSVWMLQSSKTGDKNRVWRELQILNRAFPCFQKTLIFTFAVFCFLYEATCWPQVLNDEVTNYSQPSWNTTETKTTRRSILQRLRRQVSFDACCVKKRLVYNGRITYQCRSEHPDCFSKSDPTSPLFGLCETVRNSKKVVISCRCAARI